LEDEFSATLMTLSFFASKELAEAFVVEMRQDLKGMAESIRRELPDAVFFYARLGRSIHKVLMESEEIRTEPRRTVKIGRNDRCSCGSGKKYKKCCMQ
jgi:uncharacterized protein YecA (UPF0149 family)